MRPLQVRHLWRGGRYPYTRWANAIHSPMPSATATQAVESMGYERQPVMLWVGLRQKLVMRTVAFSLYQLSSQCHAEHMAMHNCCAIPGLKPKPLPGYLFSLMHMMLNP